MSSVGAEVITVGEEIDAKIAAALTWIKSDPLAIDAVKAFPALAPIAEKIIGAIPVIGQIEAGLELAGALVAVYDSGVIKPMDANDMARIHHDLEEQ